MNWYKRSQYKLAMPPGYGIPQEVKDKIVDLRKNTNLTLKEISKEVGFGTAAISKVLKNEGVVRPRLSNEDISEIIYFYQNNIPTKELAETYGISVQQILNILKKNEVFDPSRQYADRAVVRDENKDDILKKYQEGYSVLELINEYGESQRSILNLLRQNNIHVRNMKEQSLTDRQRSRSSEKFKKNWENEELRKKMMDNMKAYHQTPEVKEKHRQRMLRMMEEDPTCLYPVAATFL